MPFFGESNPQLALFLLYYRPFPAQSPTLFSSTLLPCQTNCSPAAFSLAILRLLWHVTTLYGTIQPGTAGLYGFRVQMRWGNLIRQPLKRLPPSRGLPARSRCNAETPKVSSEAFRHLAQRLLQSTGLFSGRSQHRRCLAKRPSPEGKATDLMCIRLPTVVFYEKAVSFSAAWPFSHNR